MTVGRADCFTVPARSEEIHRAIGGSRLEVFPGGHTHHWEQLEAFNALTSAWLDGLGPVEGPGERPNGRPNERSGQP